MRLYITFIVHQIKLFNFANHTIGCLHVKLVRSLVLRCLLGYSNYRSYFLIISNY